MAELHSILVETGRISVERPPLEMCTIARYHNAKVVSDSAHIVVHTRLSNALLESRSGGDFTLDGSKTLRVVGEKTGDHVYFRGSVT